ncbi:hypothetical protein SAMN05421636_106223 [Pricia antarctica]|uniref:Uncharacterized protein n=1 Tax=Pricia antarctica TaxID=641691 RepID=A0A1G7EJW9_9FLAO|nr:hypothetical protein SAMN05421636_106223 [Pricia antarctica]
MVQIESKNKICFDIDTSLTSIILHFYEKISINFILTLTLKPR